MTRKAWFAAAALLLCAWTRPGFDDDAPLGHAAEVKGDVQYAWGSSKGVLKAGQDLFAGSTFVTGDQGQASLALENGSQVRFPAETEAKLLWDEEEKGGTLVLLYGGTVLVSTQLHSGRLFAVQSPAVVVRTEEARWQMQCGTNWNKISVLSGKLRLQVAGVQGELQLGEGDKALASIGNVRTLRLNSEELKTLSQELRDLKSKDTSSNN